jgi:1-acyl-sn-glycerol-3-phosphate acyltransferase
MFLSIEYLYGMNIHIIGSPATKLKEKQMRGERGFWICNHRTRIDWMLLWNLAFRTATLHHLRIVLKAPLRQIPIFGWAMQHFTFIFLVSTNIFYSISKYLFILHCYL